MSQHNDNIIEVRTLLCHRDVAMACLCLGSVLRRCAETIRLVIHDDGSLDALDREIIGRDLPGSRIVDRRLADEQMADRLAKHPVALDYRKRHPLALKLFDAPLMSSGTYRYIDTDIYCFHPVAGLFAEPPAGVNAIFMLDILNGYSARPQDVLMGRMPPLPWRVNSGLKVIRAGAYDLDFLAHCVANRLATPTRIEHLVEQTCFAMLAAKVGARLYDPRQVVMVHGQTKPGPPMVLGHFASTHGRPRMKEMIDAAPPPMMSATRIDYVPMRPMRWHQLFRERVGPRVRRLLGR